MLLHNSLYFIVVERTLKVLLGVFAPKSFHELREDEHQDTAYFPLDQACGDFNFATFIVLGLVFGQILLHHLGIELFGVFVRNIVVKFAAFGLNNVGLARSCGVMLTRGSQAERPMLSHQDFLMFNS